MMIFLLPLFLINTEYPSSLSLVINESNDTLTAPKKQAGLVDSLTVSNRFNCFSNVFCFVGRIQPDFLAANRYAPLLRERFDLTFAEVFLIFFFSHASSCFHYGFANDANSIFKWFCKIKPIKRKF